MTTAMVCVDASFIVRFLTNASPNSIYQEKWDEWETQGYTIVAPTLLIYEICNAFHRAVVAQQITPQEGEKLLERAVNLGVRFYGDTQLHQQAFQIAQRYSLSATYDAHYLALTERLSIELWTTDKRLFNAVKSSLSWVKFLGG
ncbi:type II toxin-antitoxin system VapC family toxin [Plectonema cf. radiosum LEGE 06105]|uniref:Type II toxin-antitoxin system VapC family toxin n=1 Tax=Plectonema cf. radiosum LEGE 06105 TaxID=945769 RepID=A0A8J7F516_9CYAN|nr:type II toxin-antitoxin system VapC family toxin [Plectonema radiosum]MBE9215280.1 type II toxin-antitoxin system VapC family toxin [Plectonema cf. radiosum LEGE 06105]